MWHIVEKKERYCIYLKKNYLELSFHFSNIFGNHLVSYSKGWREAGPDLVCDLQPMSREKEISSGVSESEESKSFSPGLGRGNEARARWRDSFGEEKLNHSSRMWAGFQEDMAQMVKNLPVMQETWVRSLAWEDALEKEMATHSSILAWKIPWMEEAGGLQSIRPQRARHSWVTSTFTSLGDRRIIAGMETPRGSEGEMGRVDVW